MLFNFSVNLKLRIKIKESEACSVIREASKLVGNCNTSIMKEGV